MCLSGIIILHFIKNSDRLDVKELPGLVQMTFEERIKIRLDLKSIPMFIYFLFL